MAVAGIEISSPPLTAPPMSAPADPDAELVRAAQRELPQCSAAFDALVARHAAAVRRRAWRMLGSGPDADDAVQEVFLSVFRALPGFVPERPFAHWLSTITGNACRIILRRSSGEARRRDGLAREAPRVTSPSRSDPLLRGVLEDLMDELPPRTRTAIRLRLVEELPYAQIATRLGMKESAVKMRISRGCQGLRERYAERAGQFGDGHALSA